MAVGEARLSLLWKAAPYLDKVSKGFVAVDVAVSGYEQWEKDSHNPSIGTGEKVARAATAGAGSAAGGWAGAQAGAAVGACVGGPVGAVVGGAVGAAIGSGVGKWVADKANEGIHNWWH